MRMIIMGCGHMGQGLAQRLSAEHQLYLYDRHPEKAQKLEAAGYGSACRRLEEGLRQSELIILAFKPQDLPEAAAELAPALKKEHIVVSLLTGTSIHSLQQRLPAIMVRMMPNLAVVYGEGVLGFCADETLSALDRARLTHIFSPLGLVYWLPESKMNALTALTGSGPAFVLVMIEAMIDAAVAMGFSAAEAQPLVHHMLLGSLSLLKNTGSHPAALKWQITSPQGTTIAGLKQLEERGLRAAILNTFWAAYKRAEELSGRAKSEE